MKHHLLLSIVAFVLIAAASCASRVLACTCGDITVTEARANADSVFLGKVIKMERSNTVVKNGIAVTFRADRFWKGHVTREVVVHTGPTEDFFTFEDLCAYHFKIGQRYIVFGFGEQSLKTDICAGTMGSRQPKTVMEQLGKALPRS